MNEIGYIWATNTPGTCSSEKCYILSCVSDPDVNTICMDAAAYYSNNSKWSKQDFTFVFFSKFTEVTQELCISLDTINISRLEATPTKRHQVAAAMTIILLA